MLSCFPLPAVTAPSSWLQPARWGRWCSAWQKKESTFTVSTYTSQSLTGNFSHLTAARATLPIPVGVCRNFSHLTAARATLPIPVGVCRNFSHLTAAEAALPIPVGVCSQICMSKQWYSCQCMGFLTRAPILIHAVAHRGCMDTVRESALELDWGKNPLLHHALKPYLYGTRFFSWTLYQLPTNWKRKRLQVTDTMANFGANLKITGNPQHLKAFHTAGLQKCTRPVARHWWKCPQAS